MHAFGGGPSTIHHDYYHDSHDEVTHPSCSQLWSNLSVPSWDSSQVPTRHSLVFVPFHCFVPFLLVLSLLGCLRVFYVFALAFPLLLASVKGNLAFIEAGSTSPEKEFSRTLSYWQPISLKSPQPPSSLIVMTMAISASCSPPATGRGAQGTHEG